MGNDDDARMTFTEHLAELRRRIIMSLVIFGLTMAVCLVFAGWLFEQIRRPLDSVSTALSTTQTTAPAPGTSVDPPVEAAPEGVKPVAQWTALNPIEPVWVQIQVAMYVALTLSLPMIIYQICAFVFPGLNPGEKRIVKFLVFGCGGFALLGLGIAYFQVLPAFLPVLMQYAPPNVVMQLRMNETVSLIMKFMLAFAISFQFPMVVFVLVYLELLSPVTLRKQRRIAIVIIAIAGAVLTPGPDPFSMMMMAASLYVLYEVSIWVSYFILWRKRRPVAEAQP